VDFAFLDTGLEGLGEVDYLGETVSQRQEIHSTDEFLNPRTKQISNILLHSPRLKHSQLHLLPILRNNLRIPPPQHQCPLSPGLPFPRSLLYLKESDVLLKGLLLYPDLLHSFGHFDPSIGYFTLSSEF